MELYKTRKLCYIFYFLKRNFDIRLDSLKTDGHMSPCGGMPRPRVCVQHIFFKNINDIGHSEFVSSRKSLKSIHNPSIIIKY